MHTVDRLLWHSVELRVELDLPEPLSPERAAWLAAPTRITPRKGGVALMIGQVRMHNLPPFNGTLARAASVFGGELGNLHRQAVEAAARHEEQEARAKLLAELERFELIDYAAVERRIIERMLERPPIYVDPCPLPPNTRDLDAMADEQIAMLGHARKLRTSGVSSTLVVWLGASG